MIPFPHKKIPSVTIFFRCKSKQREGRGPMKWTERRRKKKTGIKLTVYSLQNVVCYSPTIFHDGLSCEQRERRFDSRGGCPTMEPFTQPLAPSQHPYIIIHSEKKPGGTYGGVHWRGLRNFKVPSTHQVLSNATMDFSFSLFGKLEFAPLIVTSFILILLSLRFNIL